ncbi:MAG: TetR/AcrR family transcriptional regulator [Bacteroidales bacterium]|nr:TetR/AcrR family transcriptional regulator [Bacteroidales bacterium]
MDELTAKTAANIPSQESAELSDREHAILLAAENEFIKKGFAGARTTTIAAAAGVTHSMLHYYFRTKEALFERICHEKLSEMATKVFATLLEDHAPIKERILSAARRHFEFVKVNYRLPMLLLTEYRQDPGRLDGWFGSVKNLLTSMMAQFNAQVDEAVKRGEIVPIDMMTLFIDILALNLTSVAFAEPASMIASLQLQEYLDKRLEENLLTIRKRIEP